MIRPDPEQEAVLACRDRRIVVVAPPGTGKTHLAARLAGSEAAQLAVHERVLVLTFSNQARGRLEREIDRVVPRDLRRLVEVTNYHRFFWAGFGDHRRALGLPMALRLSSWNRRAAVLRGADAAAVKALGGDRFLLESIAEQTHAGLGAPIALAPERVNRLVAAVRADVTRGNVTFGDFGPLYWELLVRFPAVAAALEARYPVVIADEHQDASALQDALLRRIGGRRRIVLADPRQLIYGWRGADPDRLEAHRADAEQEFTLRTTHRWEGDPAVGQWLLGFRRRLFGESDPTPRPAAATIIATPAEHGENGMLLQTRLAVLGALQTGCQSVAILTRQVKLANSIRDHLVRHGIRPAQVGATDAIETALRLSEELPELDQPGLAERAVQLVEGLLPTLEDGVSRQVRSRIGPTGVRSERAGRTAAIVLDALASIYVEGRAAFFGSVVAAVEGLQGEGYHVPRADELALYQAVARSGERDADRQLDVFGARLARWMHESRRGERGVSVMTAHQAKGREFDAVVLVGATRRYFPGHDDEERRLFYVAITRGIRRWTVIAPRGELTPFATALDP